MEIELGGPALVGTLTFKALAPGLALLALAANEGGPNNPGPFVSTITFVEQNVNFTGGSVDIVAVPLPSALLLMLSAGSALFARWRA